MVRSLLAVLCFMLPSTGYTEASAVETAIRAIVAADPTAALVTVDDAGQPRTRSVDVRPLDETWTFWVATNPYTRKVAQIEGHSRVTLYFNVDREGSYVSVMGTARLVDDPEVIARISWRDDASRSAFWPEFPKDYLLIEITPEWIEVLGAGIEADAATWRPQSLEISR